jgi:hypothetical protein
MGGLHFLCLKFFRLIWKGKKLTGGCFSRKNN